MHTDPTAAETMVNATTTTTTVITTTTATTTVIVQASAWFPCFSLNSTKTHQAMEGLDLHTLTRRSYSFSRRSSGS